MNVFTRFGNWLERKSLQERIAVLEGTVKLQTELLKKQKEVADRLSRLEMHVGYRRVGQSKEAIREVLDQWNGLQ